MTVSFLRLFLFPFVNESSASFLFCCTRVALSITRLRAAILHRLHRLAIRCLLTTSHLAHHLVLLLLTHVHLLLRMLSWHWLNLHRLSRHRLSWHILSWHLLSWHLLSWHRLPLHGWLSRHRLALYHGMSLHWRLTWHRLSHWHLTLHVLRLLTLHVLSLHRLPLHLSRNRLSLNKGHGLTLY